MKALLTIVTAIAFIAIFVFCETNIDLSFVALAVFALCAKLIEKYYLPDEEKEDRA